jgi:hypothetical protein
MPRGTQSVPVPEATANPPALAPDAFDEMMEGLPEEQRQIPTHQIAGDNPAAPFVTGYVEPQPGRVLLINLRYPEEIIFLPVGNEGQRPQFVSQSSIAFINGQAMVTEEQAAQIRRVSPYIHQEPTEGTVMPFPQTGFTTRSAAVLAEYAARYADNL